FLEKKVLQNILEAFTREINEQPSLDKQIQRLGDTNYYYFMVQNGCSKQAIREYFLHSHMIPIIIFFDGVLYPQKIIYVHTLCKE
uniref:hypothetical protein n=1 Tax=Salmonella sp. s55004 TaxID=3159675 RepID=UPI0039814F85